MVGEDSIVGLSDGDVVGEDSVVGDVVGEDSVVGLSVVGGCSVGGAVGTTGGRRLLLALLTVGIFLGSF